MLKVDMSLQGTSLFAERVYLRSEFICEHTCTAACLSLRRSVRLVFLCEENVLSVASHCLTDKRARKKQLGAGPTGCKSSKDRIHLDKSLPGRLIAYLPIPPDAPLAVFSFFFFLRLCRPLPPFLYSKLDWSEVQPASHCE